MSFLLHIERVIPMRWIYQRWRSYRSNCPEGALYTTKLPISKKESSCSVQSAMAMSGPRKSPDFLKSRPSSKRPSPLIHFFPKNVHHICGGLMSSWDEVFFKSWSMRKEISLIPHIVMIVSYSHCMQNESKGPKLLGEPIPVCILHHLVVVLSFLCQNVRLKFLGCSLVPPDLVLFDGSA